MRSPYRIESGSAGQLCRSCSLGARTVSKLRFVVYGIKPKANGPLLVADVDSDTEQRRIQRLEPGLGQDLGLSYASLSQCLRRRLIRPTANMKNKSFVAIKISNSEHDNLFVLS